MGVPLINAIYENNPLVGLYTLPLLIWHPMQLVVGSFLAPYLVKFVISEKERLGIVDDEDNITATAPKATNNGTVAATVSKKEDTSYPEVHESSNAESC